MRSLKGPAEMGRAPEVSRISDVPRNGLLRQFRRAGLAGLTALGLAAGSAALLAPSMAFAQVGTVSRIDVSKLRTVRVDKALVELDRETDPYRGAEGVTKGPDGNTYTNAVTVPGKMSAIVGLSSKGRNLVVTFRPELDTDPAATRKGVRALSLDRFAEVVKQETGQELERVKLIIKQGTFERGGVTTEYTDVYVLPVNKQGRILTSLGNGQYLMFGASYFGDTLRGAVAKLAEPNDTTTLAVAMRMQR